MIRRALPAAAVTLALVVAGCTTPHRDAVDAAGAGNTSGPAASGSRTAPSAVETAGPAGSPGDARPVGSTAPAANPTVTLPLSWSESGLISTGWLTEPQVRGRFAVGFAERDGALEYSAIDSRGTILWRTIRPAACTGFAVSTAAGTPIVVLTDSAVTPHAGGAPHTGAAWQTTATAFDLATGQALWGPVPVPGTVQGPGLVFGKSAPAATLGETGPRVALSAADGTVVADEAATPEVSVVGEYDGIVVTETGGALTGIDSSAGQSLWSAPYGPDARADATQPAPPGAALIETPDGGTDVIGLATGAVLFGGSDSTAYEPLSDTWLSVTGRTVTGASAGHDEWSRQLPAPATIAAAGMGLAYLRSGRTVRALNALTGADAIAYPRDLADRHAVPLAITSDAAALFRIDGDYLMATVQRPPAG